MFVTAGDFGIFPYKLTGLDKMQAQWNGFVPYAEEENLRKLLGNLFYDAFVTGLNALPSGLDLWSSADYTVGKQVVYVVDNVADIYKCILNTTAKQDPTDSTYWTKQAPDRWVRLKFGDAFSYNSIPEKWYGMNRLVRPLIYSLWIQLTFDNLTASGVAQTKNENSDTISPNQRINEGWNDYARLAGGNHIAHNYFLGNNWHHVKNTLFGYLYCNSTTFDDLVSGKGFSSFNEYLFREFRWPGRKNFLDL